MALPNQKYNSGRVPSGGIFVNIYRPADPEDQAGATLLGRYRVESLNPSASASVTKRPDIDAGRNGWIITEGDSEGSIVVQRNIATTPSVQNGDFFDAINRIDAAGAIVIERFVIHTPDNAMDAGYRKQSASVIVDQSPTTGLEAVTLASQQAA